MTEDEHSLTDRANAIRSDSANDLASVDLAELLDDPTAPPNAHGHAAFAFLQLAFSDVEVERRFVDPLARLLTRPSLDADALVLRSLRQLAREYPAAVLDHAESICERVSADVERGAEQTGEEDFRHVSSHDSDGICATVARGSANESLSFDGSWWVGLLSSDRAVPQHADRGRSERSI